jgi:hypothetical protein
MLSVNRTMAFAWLRPTRPGDRVRSEPTGGKDAEDAVIFEYWRLQVGS